jgi:hypothetical protein
MEKEEWRDILGYEGYYQVSNQGRVKSVERKVKHYYGERIVSERILVPLIDKDGYLNVSLSRGNKVKKGKIHRLVASAFIPNPDNLPQINHKDECKTNNRVDNLEYCNAKYNSNYGTHNERCAKALINNPKISKPVLCVETGVVYPSTKEIQRKLGYHTISSIYQCCIGKKYYHTAYGYHWKYVEEKKKMDFSLF